jgi:hypothetical protein
MVAAMTDLDETLAALENWCLVRERIFAYERAPPTIWNELAEAEHRLMEIARKRVRSSAG